MSNAMARRTRALAAFVLISVALLPSSSAQSTWSKLKKGFLQQACKGGDQNACQQLANMNGNPQAVRPAQPQPAPASTPQARQETLGTDLQSQGAPIPAAGHQPADSQPAQVWVPPTQETTPAKLARPLNPIKLPDIQGIHLGMTVAQANQVLTRLAPGSQLGWYNSPIYMPTTTNRSDMLPRRVNCRMTGSLPLPPGAKPQEATLCWKPRGPRMRNASGQVY